MKGDMATGRYLVSSPCSRCGGARFSATCCYCRDCKRAKQQSDYAKNPAVFKTRALKWRQDNPEKHMANREKDLTRERDRHNEYQRSSPEARANQATRVRNRRAQIRQACGSFTHIEWLAICQKQKDRCANCGSKNRLTRDHIVPIAQGGCNYAFNIQGLCGPCNTQKSDHIMTTTMSLFDRSTR